MEEASLVRENMTHTGHERAVWGSRCMSVCLSACLASLYIYIYAHTVCVRMLPLPHMLANISAMVGEVKFRRAKRSLAYFVLEFS